mmetsp:Transcript_42573/g.77323  ORF Transcript_42573/g.77323 Transcript_42573/m.77323 type:complete len:286 (+) Transcript_42573:65-922(+)
MLRRICLLLVSWATAARVGPAAAMRPATACNTLVLTTYLKTVHDWQNQGAKHERPQELIKNFRDSILRTPGVKSIVLHDSLDKSYTHSATVQNKFTFEKVDPAAHDSLLGVNDVRFLLFREALQRHSDVEVVFTTDLFDVEVLQNPCHLVYKDPHLLYVGSEVSNTLSCDWLKQRFADMGGKYAKWYEAAVQRDTNKKLFNAGIIGGTRAHYLPFLDTMIQVLQDPELASRKLNKQINVNMAALNYVVHSNHTLLAHVFTGHPLHSLFKGYAALPQDYFKHKFLL